ncbi:MAG: dihydrolipoyl dehydrogenase [Chitinivibrionales bacterium]|nr:dihydrolipoyl dehydrogenase [Chitinivibrionales bacterium]
MPENKKHDLLVIGAGPAGYVGAIRAAQLGMNTAVVEADKLGGVCLNIGCIPSKALIHQANLYRSSAELEGMGLRIDRGHFTYEPVFKRSRKAADTLSKGVAYLLKKNGITVYNGRGMLTEPGVVTVDGTQRLSAKNILLATGSRPRSIPGFEPDHQTVLTSDSALMLRELPASLLILGGGAIGIEFAHVMNAFGVDVRVVEMLDSILPLEDREMAAVVRKSLEKRGVTFNTGTKAGALRKEKDGCTVTLERQSGETEDVRAEKVLVVVGRQPNTEELGLEALGVETERGFVTVGDYYQTSVPSLYAAGDIVPSPMLAHVGSKEAEIAVEHMAGKQPHPRIDPQKIPSAMYAEPQIASFGLSEEAAKEQGIEYKKAVFPYRGAGKSVAIGHRDGMAKVLYDPKLHEILGCHVVGAEATELIHELLLAKSAELLPEDIATMIHAHPTLSEVVMEAMRAVEGWAIHV